MGDNGAEGKCLLADLTTILNSRLRRGREFKLLLQLLKRSDFTRRLLHIKMLPTTVATKPTSIDTKNKLEARPSSGC